MGKEWNGIVDEPEYSDDEDRVYNESFEILRGGLGRGLSFDEACAELKVEDEGLRHSVMDDFLKITIAEDHFGKGVSLAEVAGKLRVEPSRLEKARDEMLREVQKASIEVHHQEMAEGGWEVPEADGPGGTKGNA